MKVKLSAACASVTLQACPLQVRDGSGSVPRVALQASLSKACFPLRRGQHGSRSKIFSTQGPALAGTWLRSSEEMANAAFGADSY